MKQVIILGSKYTGGIGIRNIFMVILLLIYFAVVYGQSEVAISTAAGDQLAPKISAGENCFFIIWQDHRSGASNQNVFGQVVFPDGSTGSSGYPVCIAPGNQNSPAIAYCEADNQFLAVWFDQSATDQMAGNFTDCDGIVDTNFVIGTITSNVSSPEMACSEEACIFVWTVRSAYWETRYAHIGTDGIMLGDYDTLSDAGSKNPDIAFNGHKFLAVWKDSTATEQGIFGRYFNSDATPDGDVFTIVSDVQASEPAVCGISHHSPDSAGFAVAYQKYNSSTGSDIYAKIIFDGEISGFTVTSADMNQSSPDIGFHGDGFFVVWQDARETPNAIYGAFFGLSGLPIGEEFPLSDAGSSQQAPKTEFVYQDSTYLTVWTDFRTANQDIYGAIITPPEPTDAPTVSSVYPSPAAISACDTPMVITFSSPSDIDWSTLAISFDGAIYDTSSPEITAEDITVTFYPGTYPAESVDTIVVCVDDITNIDGVHIDSTYCWSWIWDGLSPEISMTSPVEDTLYEIPSTIVFAISDYGAGIDSSSIHININASSFTLTDLGVYWDGYTLTLNMSELGFMSLPETNIVSIEVNDLAECSNYSESEDTFYYIIIGEGPVASVETPAPGSITACPNQQIIIQITDEEGVDETTITLLVNGTLFDSLENISFIPPQLVFTPDFDYPEGEVSVELLEVQDVEGNPLSSPLSYNFIVDLTPPEIVDATFPDSIELDTTSTGDFIITAEDNYCSALDFSRCYIRLSHYGGGLIVQWEDEDLIIPDSMQIGVEESLFFWTIDSAHTTTDDTFQICVRIADAPDYVCPLPNILDTCWIFIYHGSGIQDYKVPRNVKLTFSPNPFNKSLEIVYSAPDGGKIEILDIGGHIVRRSRVRGDGVFIWDTCDDEGLPMPSGTYTIQLKTPDGTISKSATLVK